ncbi:hypothetical protein MC885_011944 [Smutsia gigantea]|nr:hypothetical protein MC885_011944 [Smutsia gigantea]
MAPRVAATRPTCCCLNVRIATTALAIYHVHIAVHRALSGGGPWQGLLQDLADRLPQDRLSLLIGVVKNREKFLLPFLSLQIMDFFLCLLTLLGSYIELPTYLKFASRSSRAGPSKVPLMTLQLLDFCLSILTLCSSYMENYFPSQEGMAHNQFIKMMIIFSIAFITVLILKVSGPCPTAPGGVVRLLRPRPTRVVLPSYEEALSLPCKTPEGSLAPPPYSEV